MKTTGIYRKRKQYFIIETRKGITKLKTDSINYFEKDLRLVHVHADGGIYSFYESFKNLEKIIDDRFCRCHNSYIVNLDKVVRVERYNTHLANGEMVPISQRFYSSTRYCYLRS